MQTVVLLLRLTPSHHLHRHRALDLASLYVPHQARGQRGLRRHLADLRTTVDRGRDGHALAHHRCDGREVQRHGRQAAQAAVGIVQQAQLAVQPDGHLQTGIGRVVCPHDADEVITRLQRGGRRVGLVHAAGVRTHEGGRFVAVEIEHHGLTRGDLEGVVAGGLRAVVRGEVGAEHARERVVIARPRVVGGRDGVREVQGVDGQAVVGGLQ